jgi:hypothetical protein
MNREILNIVNRVLSEEVNGKIRNVKRRLFESKEMCSECGSGKMYEGECMECGYSKGEMGESKKLSKGQKYIARQAEPKDKIDANDFKKLRAKKTETKEGKKFPDLSGDGKVTRKDVLLGRGVKLRKESVSYKLVLDESTNEVFYFDENEMINIIENVVLEEKKKKKKTTKKTNITKSSQSKSKKENDDYVSSVIKKMKDYLKDGSKGSYEMKPKHFPKGNGELAKMSKMAYVPSDTAQEYIDNFTAAGLENLDYDEIHPNEDWVTMNLVGGSRTGNNPEWANAVETEVGKRRNKIRKNNLLAKVKRDAYQKDDQPVRIDRSGQDYGDNVDSLMKKYSTKKLKKESVIDNQVINEMQEIKNLMSYNKKTQ